MFRSIRPRRWTWSAGPVVAAVALGALTAASGAGTPPALWTERPIVSAPGHPDGAPPWVELARALKPAVVNVSTTRIEEARPELRGPSGAPDPFEQFFKPFFERGPRRQARSLGSGFLISADGRVVTNNHVVAGAREVRVKLADGREFAATVLGRDPRTDLALLKIEASGLPVVPLGDSSAVQVGEPVMAIGNPFGLAQTVTTGIVSATGRVIGEGPYDDFIQTDASINPGNSGGPLINARGQAIGINTAIVSRSGGSVGIGFAIPIALAKPVIAQLAEVGHVARGWLGISIQPLTADLARGFGLPTAEGALVSAVVEGSPAMKAGLMPGDVVTAFDGHPVARPDELPRLVAMTPVGRAVPITVTRDRHTLTLTATIARLEDTERPVASRVPTKAPLGLRLEPLTPALARELGLEAPRGALVRDVEADSPAAQAGVQPGDVILEAGHRAVTTPEDLKQAVEQHPGSTPLVLRVHRRGGSLYVAVPA